MSQITIHGQIRLSIPSLGQVNKRSMAPYGPASHVLKEDFALVPFQPGIVSDHELAILGGIDTTGTEGAALLVTSKVGVEELLKALPLSSSTPEAANGRAFQALVRVDVKKGYQVLGSHLVTLHPLNSARAGIPTSSSAP